MQTNQANITQIAIKAGYSMPSSFNKAFKEMFGINPSEYKKQYAQKRQVYTDITPLRTEKIEHIKTYMMRHIGDYNNLDASMQKIVSFAIENKLISKDFILLAIPHDNPTVTDEKKLRFDICIKNTKELDLSQKDWLRKTEICGGHYAVFLHKGSPLKLIDTYNSIFGTWLYRSNIHLRDEPIFQKLLNNKFEVAEEDLRIEIYVPIA
jgi:AraC family transcriptional regulator